MLIGLAGALTVFFGLAAPENVFLNLFLVPSVLIACMWGYKHYCFNTLKLSSEETGDSLYYLGFLFTATALAAGILVIGFKLQRRGGIEEGDVVASFLPSFGIALLTTICGLCWRVVLSRGVGEIDTAYSDLKDQLLNTAADLTEQANLTTEQFQVLLTVLKQKAQEVKHEFLGFADSLSTAFDQSGMVQSAVQLKESAETLHRAAGSLSVGQDNMVRSAAQLRESADDLQKVAGALAASSKDLDSRLEPVVGSLTAAATQLNETTTVQMKAMESAEGLYKAAGALAESSKNLDSVVRLATGDLTAAATQLNETVAAQAKAVEVAGALAESSKDVNSRLEPAIGNLTAAATQLNETAAAQTQAMKDVAALVANIRPADVGQGSVQTAEAKPKTAVFVMLWVTGVAVAVWVVLAILLGEFVWWD